MPGSPACLPGDFPDGRRRDLGGGFTNASVLGGFDEFREFFFRRPSNVATFTLRISISAFKSVINPSRSANWASNNSIRTSRSSSRASNDWTVGTSDASDM